MHLARQGKKKKKEAQIGAKKKINKHPDQENKRLTFEKVTLFTFVLLKKNENNKGKVPLL